MGSTGSDNVGGSQRTIGLARAARRAATLVAAVLVVVVTILGTVGTGTASAGTNAGLSQAEQAHLDLINAHRAGHGLSRLVVDPAAQADARTWAHRLAASGTIWHDPGLAADCRSASTTCSGWAENVGYASSHQRVFELFLGSAGHARNIRISSPAGTAPFRIGVGVVEKDGLSFVAHRYYRCECTSPSFAASDPAEDRAFAAALSHDFLGRQATTARLDALVASLRTGATRADLLADIAYSDEWIGALIDGFYRDTLGRAADAGGRAFWTSQIRAGRTPAAVAAEFYGSDEYHRRAGGTDQAWVASLYRALLGRSVDAAGLDHWVAQARRTSRPAAAFDLYQSVESRQRRVDGLFRALLGRPADRSGLAHWTVQLADGRDVRLAIDLAGSAEYLSRALLRFG